MPLKEKLTEALNTMIAETRGLDTWISAAVRESSGNYEHWAPKDLLAHSAEWAERRVQLLADTDDVPSGGGEELGEINRTLFDRHRDTPWSDIIEMLNHGLRALIREVDRRDDSALAAVDPNGGGENTVWRGIAFYGIVHSLTHIAQALIRAGNAEAAVRLQRAMATPLLSIDSGGAWKGMVEFNLARVLSLTGNREEAISQCRQAIADNPDLAQYVANDPDFEPIRGSL